eukprot:CAMPEP_0114244628 /NCGR_PEP_ID=MMETSP0058-20121206/11445_1 /TAXON_ID=36894 /ORGANISM="Pyramimonas parkeae, CCMP726" /LENGTH=363 /DNA_ID=CAMNT_0001357589 /DNA_START=928 /DNA_END=2019 /DNA_ORIENTATION=-
MGPTNAGRSTAVRAWECLAAGGSPQAGGGEGPFRALRVAWSDGEGGGAGAAARAVLKTPYPHGARLSGSINVLAANTAGESEASLWTLHMPPHPDDVLQLVGHNRLSLGEACQSILATPRHLLLGGQGAVAIWPLLPLLVSNSRSTDAIGKAACETKETCANTTTHLDAHRPSNKGAAPAGSCLVQLQRDPLAHAEDSRHPFQVLDMIPWAPGQCLVLDSWGRIHVVHLPNEPSQSASASLVQVSMCVERMTTMHATSADQIGGAAARAGGIIRGGDCKYLVLSGANTVYVCTLDIHSGAAATVAMDGALGAPTTYSDQSAAELTVHKTIYRPENMHDMCSAGACGGLLCAEHGSITVYLTGT